MAWNVPMVMDLAARPFAEPLLQPGAHFLRRLMGKGDGGDLLRRDTFRRSTRYAMRSTSVRVLPVPGPATTADTCRPPPGWLPPAPDSSARAVSAPVSSDSASAARRPLRGCFCALGAAKPGQLQQGGLPVQQFQLVGLKHGDHAVFAVVARLLVITCPARRRRRASATPGPMSRSMPRPAAAPAGCAIPGRRRLSISRYTLPAPACWTRGPRCMTVGQQLRQGHQAFEGAWDRGPGSAPVGQLAPPGAAHPQSAFVRKPGSGRSGPSVSSGSRQQPQAPVAVQMVLALLREKLDRPLRSPRRSPARVSARHRYAPQDSRLASRPSLCGGMRVGIGYQQIASPIWDTRRFMGGSEERPVSSA